jgi:hypothetical protein
MSDALDRLKALNSKLEAKLSAKKGTSAAAAPRKEREPVVPTRQETAPVRKATVEAVAAKEAASAVSAPVILKGQGPTQTVSPNASASLETLDGNEAAEVRRLSQILIHYLRIDANLEPTRAANMERLAQLYLRLDIGKKAPNIHELFIYKAMNISGIGLKEDDFGEIREGKYVQVIAITYEPDKNGKKKAKNVSLGYFGKAETLDPERKNQVIEFVLRWRYEKAFQNLEHYRHLLERVTL